ncbi:MAG: flagellar transcriptional regulator FlhD [Dyella sp.]|nr:flagellar transcriptional regulator FlhD [Dyella sp.]MBV8270658.1 flagellar transcriptional regulator FlhD [Cupriavidus sp.]
METRDILQEVGEVNLAFLMLAQRLIRSNLPEAAYRLGITSKIAKIISELTTTQVIKLACCGTLLSDFRLNDPKMLSLLTSINKQHNLQHAHAALLLATRRVREI